MDTAFKRTRTGIEHEPFLVEAGLPAAVLVHGYPGTPAEMRPLAGSLQAQGWTTQGVLLPGFGSQIATLPERRYAEWVDTVVQAVSSLQRNHRPVVLMGLSMGGAVSIVAAARLAQAGTPVAGLALFAPFWRINHLLWSLLPTFRVLFSQVQPFTLIKLNFQDPATRRGISRFLPNADLDDVNVQAYIRKMKLPLAMFDQIRQVGQESFRLAPTITVPTLVIQGRQDQLVTPAETARLRARFTTPPQYLEVETGHVPIDGTHESWPRVVTTVSNFVSTLVAPTGR